MEIFDLVDIQRMRHPKPRKFTYESKSLKLKNWLFLIAKNLSGDMKNSEIYHEIAPDHDAILYFAFLAQQTSSGTWTLDIEQHPIEWYAICEYGSEYIRSSVQLL